MNSTPFTHKAVYDISVLLGVEAPVFPGDTPYSRELTLTIEESGICDVSKLTMSSHAGTHLDAPCHHIQNTKSIDRYHIEDFILPARVIDIENKDSITPAELQNVPINQGDAILFKTDNSMSGLCRNNVFSEKYVYLSAEAADFCVSRNVRLVGIDYVSIDRFDDASHPAHHKLLGNDILILEGVDLKDVPAGIYTLFCLPLKIEDGDGSPVRAILINS